MELTGTNQVDGLRPKNRTLHFQREPLGHDGSLKDQRWVSRGSKGQFEVALAGPGKWRVTSMVDDWRSGFWAEFNFTEDSPPDPLEVHFETGTLVLTGLLMTSGSSSP